METEGDFGCAGVQRAAWLDSSFTFKLFCTQKYKHQQKHRHIIDHRRFLHQPDWAKIHCFQMKHPTKLNSMLLSPRLSLFLSSVYAISSLSLNSFLSLSPITTSSASDQSQSFQRTCVLHQISPADVCRREGAKFRVTVSKTTWPNKIFILLLSSLFS